MKKNPKPEGYRKQGAKSCNLLCLKCGGVFKSPNKVNIRLCTKCKKENDGETVGSDFGVRIYMKERAMYGEKLLSDHPC